MISKRLNYSLKKENTPFTVIQLLPALWKLYKNKWKNGNLFVSPIRASKSDQEISISISQHSFVNRLEEFLGMEITPCRKTGNSRYLPECSIDISRRNYILYAFKVERFDIINNLICKSCNLKYLHRLCIFFPTLDVPTELILSNDYKN